MARRRVVYVDVDALPRTVAATTLARSAPAPQRPAPRPHPAPLPPLPPLAVEPVAPKPARKRTAARKKKQAPTELLLAREAINAGKQVLRILLPPDWWEQAKEDAKKRKFGNVKIPYDGHLFDSESEAGFWEGWVKPRIERGEITDVDVHPVYELQPAFRNAEGQHRAAIKYEGDFAWVEVATGRRVVADVKGQATALFRQKAKEFEHRYPDIRLWVVTLRD